MGWLVIESILVAFHTFYTNLNIIGRTLDLFHAIHRPTNLQQFPVENLPTTRPSVSASSHQITREWIGCTTMFERSIITKSKFVKELGILSEKLAHAKKEMDVVRAERKKKEKTVKHVGGGSEIVEQTTKKVLAREEDPKPVAIPKAAKKPKKDKITLAMREQIWKKYIGREIDCLCPVCQTRVIGMTDFSVGHIISEATGGVTDITNLVPICGNCNSRMSTENLFEYSKKNYKRDPVFPGLPH